MFSRCTVITSKTHANKESLFVCVNIIKLHVKYSSIKKILDGYIPLYFTYQKQKQNYHCFSSTLFLFRKFFSSYQ